MNYVTVTSMYFRYVYEVHFKIVPMFDNERFAQHLKLQAKMILHGIVLT